MERKGRGVINAYILNLMTHADNLRMDEQEIRDKIEKRYGKRNKRIRPQHVRVLHLEPLVKNHWLRFLPDKGKYERIGELRRVRPYETLHDQFKGLPEEYIDAHIYEKEFNRKNVGPENFEDSLTEKEYDEYIQKLSD
jgi:hypothetical protein